MAFMVSDYAIVGHYTRRGDSMSLCSSLPLLCRRNVFAAAELCHRLLILFISGKVEEIMRGLPSVCPLAFEQNN